MFWVGEKTLCLPTMLLRKNFYNPKDKPLPVASILKQPKLARTLNIIANKGDQAFYEGEIADWIVEDSLANGGLITKGDLANYSAKDRVPIESFYRGYKIVSHAPSSQWRNSVITNS